MPVIKVWCLPKESEQKLRDLHRAIVVAVIEVEELNLKNEKEMTVLFPADIMNYGLGKDIVVEISGLFDGPSRPAEVCYKLAKKVGSMVSGFYPKAKVEVFVQKFHPASGFWTSKSPN